MQNNYYAREKNLKFYQIPTNLLQNNSLRNTIILTQHTELFSTTINKKRKLPKFSIDQTLIFRIIDGRGGRGMKDKLTDEGEKAEEQQKERTAPQKLVDRIVKNN